MTTLRISLPSDAVIRLDHLDGWNRPYAVVITPAALAAMQASALFTLPGHFVVAIHHGPGETWPDLQGVLLATAALEHGSVILGFAARDDAKACLERLERERAL